MVIVTRVKVCGHTFSVVRETEEVISNTFEVLINELYDKVYDEYHWGASVDLKEKDGEFYIHYEDEDTQENSEIYFDRES